MKIKVIFFSLFLCIGLNASILEEKKYPSNEIIKKVFVKQTNINNEDVLVKLDAALNYIDDQNFLNNYKKHLLKNLVMLNYQAFLLNEDKDKLIKIAEYLFPTSMCAAYQFQDDLIRQINNTSQFFIKNNEEAKILESSFLYMQEKYLNEAQQQFQPEESFFIENCTK